MCFIMCYNYNRNNKFHCICCLSECFPSTTLSWLRYCGEISFFINSLLRYRIFAADCIWLNLLFDDLFKFLFFIVNLLFVLFTNLHLMLCLNQKYLCRIISDHSDICSSSRKFILLMISSQL